MEQKNTYPISENSNNVVNIIKNEFISKGTSILDDIDQNTLKEINKLCHPNILLYNIVRNDYILKRFITVLIYNFGYNHGENFEENTDKEENINVIEFIKDILKVANITFVDEPTKQIFLRIKFVEKNLKPQVIDHVVRANLEFNILNSVQININQTLFEWLHNKKILDIGCGHGNFLGELEYNQIVDKINLHGIDVSSYINQKYQNKINFHMYLENMKFPNVLSELDFISFFMSIHHMELKKLHLILMQLYTMLKNDGYLYIKEHLVECVDDVIFFKFMEMYFYFVEGYIPNVPVEDNYYTKESLIKIFELYGFKLITYFETNKCQPFKPIYYVFQKNILYNPLDSETTYNILSQYVNNMKNTQIYKNSNDY